MKVSLGSPRTMGPHDVATTELGQLTRMQRLGHRADLVHFEQEAVVGDN